MCQCSRLQLEDFTFLFLWCPPFNVLALADVAIGTTGSALRLNLGSAAESYSVGAALPLALARQAGRLPVALVARLCHL